MSETPSEQPAANEPIDARNNPESQAAEADRPSLVARASDGGPPPSDAPRTGETVEPDEGGVAAGDPLAGVTISEADRDEAVEPDDGPTGHDGPPGGHA